MRKMEFKPQSLIINPENDISWDEWLRQTKTELKKIGYKECRQCFESESFSYWKTFKTKNNKTYQIGVLFYDFRYKKNIPSDFIGVAYICIDDNKMGTSIGRNIELIEVEKIAKVLFENPDEAEQHGIDTSRYMKMNRYSNICKKQEKSTMKTEKINPPLLIANLESNTSWDEWLFQTETKLREVGYEKYFQNNKNEDFCYWKVFKNGDDKIYQVGIRFYDFRKYMDRDPSANKIGITYECMLFDEDRVEMSVSKNIELVEFEKMSKTFFETMSQRKQETTQLDVGTTISNFLLDKSKQYGVDENKLTIDSNYGEVRLMRHDEGAHEKWKELEIIKTRLS